MMIGSKKRRVYGDNIGSLFSLLDNLRLKYREQQNTKSKIGARVIELPEFGIVILATTPGVPAQKLDIPGVEVMEYNVEGEIPESEEFGETLMWLLIERGYMAFIREHQQGGNGRVFNSLIMRNGWGQRILERRLKDWKERADRRFMYERLKNLMQTFGISEILSRFPGTFDYLS